MSQAVTRRRSDPLWHVPAGRKSWHLMSHQFIEPCGQSPLRRSNRSPSRSTSLSGVQFGSLGHSQLLRLGDRLVRFRQDQFDVAWVGHVGIDATVGTVGATALLRGLVDLDVLDNEFGGVETLGVGVGFGILEQAQEEFGRLDGVAGSGDSECFACVRKNCQSRYSSVCVERVRRGTISTSDKSPS